MYKDLREFIERVDALHALRRIEGADPASRSAGITEVAAGRPDCPALLFDAIKGFPRALSRVHQCRGPARSARRSRSASIRRCVRSMR